MAYPFSYTLITERFKGTRKCKMNLCLRELQFRYKWISLDIR